MKFLKKANKKHGRCEQFVTDKLRSYGAEDLGASDRQETGRWLNNRGENSHLPFRRRERAMLRFRRMRSLQKFASVHASVTNHFNQERSLSSRPIFKANRAAVEVLEGIAFCHGRRLRAALPASTGFLLTRLFRGLVLIWVSTRLRGLRHVGLNRRYGTRPPRSDRHHDIGQFGPCKGCQRGIRNGKRPGTTWTRPAI